MNEGTIKFFNTNGGFGFIWPSDGGDEVFVHITQILSGTQPQRGQRCTYDVGKSSRTGRVQAERVRLL